MELRLALTVDIDTVSLLLYPLVFKIPAFLRKIRHVELA